MKISSEFDSEENCFINKASMRLLDGLLKFKGTIQSHGASLLDRSQCEANWGCDVHHKWTQSTLDGKLRYPLVGLFTKNFSLDCDVEQRNCLVAATTPVGGVGTLTYRHDWKAKMGVLTSVLRSRDKGVSVELTHDIPREAFEGETWRQDPGFVGHLVVPTKATLLTGNMQLSYVPPLKEDEYGGASGLTATYSVPYKMGLAYGQYSQAYNSLDLKYSYKDEEVTVTSTVTLPSKDAILNFKRQFNPAHKVSLMYDVREVAYSVVYKYKPAPDYKLKAGHDSKMDLSWASVWVGPEECGASKAPHKLKAQLMVQVPHSNWRHPIVLFKVKKRWDFAKRWL